MEKGPTVTKQGWEFKRGGKQINANMVTREHTGEESSMAPPFGSSNGKMTEVQTC